MTEKIRVAHTLTRLAGGPFFRTDHLLRFFDRERFDVRLFYGYSSGWDPVSHEDVVQDAPYASRFIPSMQREIRAPLDALAYVELLQAFREFRPHIVHTHESKDGVLARLAARACRVPVVIRHYHGFLYGKGYFGPSPAPHAPLYLSIERALNRQFTDGIVNISPRLQQQAIEAYRLATPEKMVVIYDAFDLRKYRGVQHHSEARVSFGIPRRSCVFLMVATFLPPKNHAGAVRAFALFARKHPDPPPYLLLASAGRLQDEIRRLVQQLGLSERVRFLGHRNDIPALLGAADAFVMSSTSEGTPGALIEALAAGVPAACTRVGGIPDITKGNERAALAPPEDDAALAEAMERARFCPPDMLRVAREIEEEYDAARIAEDTSNFYRRLLQQKGMFLG